MHRLSRWLLLSLALLQWSGAAAVLAAPTCEGEHHRNQEQSGDCAPDCAACPCCVQVPAVPVTIVSRIEPMPDTARPLRASADSFLLMPPVRDILHVPRAAA